MNSKFAALFILTRLRDFSAFPEEVSKVKADDDITMNAGANLVIVNAVDLSFHQTESKKEGSVKTVQPVSSGY